MPIKDIYIDGKTAEVHVVAGHPFPLGGWLLGVTDTADNSSMIDAYLAGHDDITVSFQPRFNGTVDGNLFKGHGVTVNRKTGNIAVAHNLPSPRLYNFIVDMKVTDTASGKVFTEMARVHVHDHIKRIWMTPGQIAIHRRSATDDNTGYKFSVRAEYDDDVIGDITEDRYIQYSDPGDHVAGLGNLIIKATDAADALVTINAFLEYAPTTLKASAVMKVLDTWAASGPILAELVPGSAPLPAPADVATMMQGIEARRNVLFLGDGFTSSQKAEYDKFVDAIVHFMGQALSAPYDRLVGSMNFWRAAIEADQEEISVGAQAVTILEDGKLIDAIIPPPKAPPASMSATYVLSGDELFHMIGLPVRAHVGGTDDAQLRADWVTLYGADPYQNLGETNIKRDERIKDWRQFGNWGLVEEIDSPLGIVNGNLKFGGNEITDLHIGRMTRTRMDDLLNAIVAKASDGAGTEVQLPIGRCFATRADGTRPRDHDLVCIIIPSATREKNGDGYFLTAMRPEINILQDPTSNVHTVLPRVLTGALEPHIARTFTHELSHSFHLGDEYGDADGPPTTPIDVHYANIMNDAEALDGGGNYSGDEIRWLWHRIELAAVVVEMITVNQGTVPPTIAIPVRSGEGEVFARLHARLTANNRALVVHVRERDPDIPLRKRPAVSVPLEVTAAHPDLIVAKVSPLFFPYPNKVVQMDLPLRFGPGSVVYKARPAPASVLDPATYPYAEMVAKNIKDQITSNQAPLTQMPSVVDKEVLQLPLLDPGTLAFAGPHPERDLARIVGLYSGGMSNHIGVFHPTGFCIMRSHKDDVHKHGEREFCAVCRYILTEVIDPAQHGPVDQWYDGIYPVK